MNIFTQTSLVLSIWMTVTSIYLIFIANYIPPLQLSRNLCGKIGPCQWIICVTFSYFLRDLIIAMTRCVCDNSRYDRFNVTFHALMGIAIYGFSLFTHSLHRWAILSSFIESAKIFLHTYLLLKKYGSKTAAQISKYITC